jgi:trans-aconitate 2-methyltransferase
MQSSSDGHWEPDQYERFKAERAQPFHDLLALVVPVPGGRVVDLGCGTGELTRRLHEHTRAAQTLGVDSSPEMLARARGVEGGGVRFAAGDIAAWRGDGYDLVFSNAALHWLPDHPRLLERLARAVAAGGQLAVQVPANGDHPSHTVATALAQESPYAEVLAPDPPPDPAASVLRPEDYSATLDALGFDEQHVRLQVYAHRLASSSEVVEWAKGTMLTSFRARLPDTMYRQYLAEYRQRLVAVIGDETPYLYTFKRILFWGRRAR